MKNFLSAKMRNSHKKKQAITFSACFFFTHLTYAMNIYEGMDERENESNIMHSSLSKTIQNIETEQGSVSHNNWTLSLFYEPECSTNNTSCNVGHLVVFLMGKTNDKYRVWAADFMDDIRAYNFEWAPMKVLASSLGPNLGIMPGFVRTTSNNRFTNFLTDIREKSDQWTRRTWSIRRENAEALLNQVTTEQNNPPYYNAFNHNPWSSFYPKSTYNCAGWAASKVKAATGETIGTWLALVTGLRIPSIEAKWNHK